MKPKQIYVSLILMLSTFSSPAQQILKKTGNPVLIEKPLKIIQTTPDVSNIKMCVDYYPNTGNLPQRDYSAIQQPPKINADGTLPSVRVIRQPLAGETMKMWNPGQTIGVFISTQSVTESIRQKVMFFARKWEAIANVKFSFVTNVNDAQIKVDFGTDMRSWSWIGRDVLFNPLGFYTMHYGWFTDATSDADLGKTVMHEFGHALGFIHEHQSPAAGIQWDKEKAYAYFAKPPNSWSRIEVDINLFAKYSANTITNSQYDPNSIMHYAIAPGLTTNGLSSAENYTFSNLDKFFASQVYPFPISPGNAIGTLQTGDDCDQVDFNVEYLVVPNNKIEFVLQLGQNNNKKVTWWKQIVVPLKNNQNAVLWVQNHSLIASENRTSATIQINATDLDKGNGIAFWKAKMFGVHTLLPYRWNVLPAITGGCRVKLIWKNDSCL